MELLLKLPKAKLPFIGIVFGSVREACRLNEHLINSPKDKVYTLTFMQPNKDGVEIRIRSENGKDYVIYRRVKCDPVQLENFMFMTNRFQDFNFGHVLRDFDRDLVVKTNELGKPFLLKLQGIFMMS